MIKIMESVLCGVGSVYLIYRLYLLMRCLAGLACKSRTEKGKPNADCGNSAANVADMAYLLSICANDEGFEKRP